jgi:Bardet-Biedl syndrome 1 protein
MFARVVPSQLSSRLSLPHPLSRQVRLAKHVAVGCMNDVIHAYQPNGDKSWSIYLPCHILAMQRMEVISQRMTTALVVALSNGEPN